MSKRIDDDADVMRRALLTMTVMAPTLAAAAVDVAEAAPTGELPADLAKAAHDYDQATFRSDIAAYRELVAEEYILVNSDASKEDKEQSIIPFNQPTFKIDPYVNEEPLQIVWDDGAVLGGRLRLSWTQDGKRHTRLVRTAHVWARRDGHWQLMYTQVTRVSE